MRSLSLRTMVLGIGLLALAACGKQQAPPPSPPQVGVITAEFKDVPLTKDLVGRLSAFRSGDVRARVQGVLLKRSYVEGSEVKRGQLLFQIDPAPYQAALAQAQGQLARDTAILANAKTDLARYQALAQQNAISNQQLVTQAATVKADEGVIVAFQLAYLAKQTVHRCRDGAGDRRATVLVSSTLPKSSSGRAAQPLDLRAEAGIGVREVAAGRVDVPVQLNADLVGKPEPVAHLLECPESVVARGRAQPIETQQDARVGDDHRGLDEECSVCRWRSELVSHGRIMPDRRRRRAGSAPDPETAAHLPGMSTPTEVIAPRPEPLWREVGAGVMSISFLGVYVLAAAAMPLFTGHRDTVPELVALLQLAVAVRVLQAVGQRYAARRRAASAFRRQRA